MSGVYGGIDLHSNNSVIAVKDAAGTLLYRQRLNNDLQQIKQALAPYRERLTDNVGVEGRGFVSNSDNFAAPQFRGAGHNVS